jgi:hypothetical protein
MIVEYKEISKNKRIYFDFFSLGNKKKKLSTCYSTQYKKNVCIMSSFGYYYVAGVLLCDESTYGKIFYYQMIGERNIFMSFYKYFDFAAAQRETWGLLYYNNLEKKKILDFNISGVSYLLLFSSLNK